MHSLVVLVQATDDFKQAPPLFDYNVLLCPNENLQTM